MTYAVVYMVRGEPREVGPFTSRCAAECAAERRRAKNHPAWVREVGP